MAIITKNINEALSILNSGKLIGIPTETVYGLAADATNEKAVQQIFKVKNRPSNNPLILHFPNLDAAIPYFKNPTKKIEILAEKFWPGPLTLLLDRSDLVPEIVTAGSKRVAVRVPAHPLTLQLLEKFNKPLAAPSANPSGYISPTTPWHVEKQLGNKIPLILDGGPCSKGIESTIMGWNENNVPVVYRLGNITPEEIGQCIGTTPLVLNKSEKKLEAPGMLSKHYAPKTPTLITDNLEMAINKHLNKNLGIIRYMPANATNKNHTEFVLSETGNLNEIARNLYAKMHEMDALNLDLIVIEAMPDEGIGIAINDRLRRASTYRS